MFTQLEAGDFETPELSECFAELQALWRKDGRIDTATIAHCRTADTARQCMEFVPSASEESCALYIRHVSDAAKVRRAQGIALGIAMEASDPEEMLQQCAALEKALGGSKETAWVNTADGFVRFWERQHGEPPDYIRCGVFPTFDRMTYMQRGDYLVIAGRPSAGKTMVSLNLALGWAKKGKRVAYFSLETSPDKIMDRIISTYFGVLFSEVKAGTVATDDGEMMQDSAEFGKLPISVCSASGKSVAWMRAEAARQSADIAIVDYIGLIKGRGKDRYEQVTNVSLDLHAWSQGDNILVAALCQLNRQGASDPQLTDLRESGQIEQDADVVVLLNRRTDAESGEVTEYTFDIAKNKEGQCGKIPMAWQGEFQRVSEIDDRHGG